MCIQTALQSKIAKLTDNGDTIARFLADTAHGDIPGAKLHHRVDAAKTLARYGFAQNGHDSAHSEPAEYTSGPLNDTPVEAEILDGSEERQNSAPPVVLRPTLRDIVAYPVARYIRERTDDGESILSALRDIMQGGSYSRFDREFGNPPVIKPHQRLAAAKELMGRAMGESRPPRADSAPVRLRPQFSVYGEPVGEHSLEFDDDDPVNLRFARLVRDKTNNGIDAAETMISIVENSQYEDDWLPGHRLTAAKELIHRAFDLNYDAVTWREIDAYRRATEDEEAHKRVELDRARHQARLSELIREFDEARAADNEEAMQAAEKKYVDYQKYGEEGNPDDPIDYSGSGPADPDPTADFYRPGLNREGQAKFDWQVARRHADKKNDASPNTAASYIRTSKLTIPLADNSLPP